MGTYVFKDAAGNRYRVDAPDGMSEADAFDRFNAKMKMGGKISVDPAEAGKMALEGTSLPYRAAVNLGAGMDTLWQGARQLFGGGMDDAQLQEKRALDQAAADSTTGGGALQVAGEILPTMAIPAGGFARGAQLAGRGTTLLARLLAGAGEQALKGGAMQAARMGTGAAIADAALAGGAAGALQPVTSDESRLFNTAGGAVTGAVLPALVAGVRGAGGVFSRSGAQGRALDRVAKELGGGDELAAAAQKVRDYKPGAFVSDIPMSTGEILQDPRIAALERQARAKFTPDWQDLGAMQAEMRYNALRDATAGADDLLARATARDAATGPLRDRALAAAGKDAWFHEPVVQKIASLAQGEAGADPAVKKIISYVGGELDNGISPERLYRVRKVLADRLSGPLSIGTDELGAAAKAAQSDTLGVIKAIDASLDKASGGKWTPYLERYGQQSKGVTSAKAEAALRDVFEKEGAPMTMGASGPVPAITGTRLGRAIDKVGSNAFGDTLEYGTRDALAQLQENIGRSELLQRAMKNAGTSGGGSNSYMDLAQSALAKNQISRTGQVVHYFGNKRRALEDAALSDALRNPDLFVAGVEKKLAASKPLTRSEEIVLTAIRGLSTSTLPAVATQ